jgi:thiol:disulfide interchange protein DsbD
MYDIVLPSGLGRLTASGEGRGGLIGVVFMALTFTVISFACVAPVYGGFIALSASASSAGDWLKLVLGALAFSVTFALPFFLLALFPFLLKALPKSGSWLNTVKVVMGFLELAAAFKFLRAAELNFFVKTEFLTYDLVLGVYIALSLACGLYLLGLYRLPHDHGAHETLSVPRLLFSIAFLGLALYMLPGLFTAANGEQQRPGGTVFAWLDAFLLPEDSGPVVGPPGAPTSDRLAWGGDLKDALRRGETEKKLVFLDFTATTCTNCKYNERNVFIKPEVKNLLSRYVLVHLYTDNVPSEYHSTTTGAQNHDFQTTQFRDDTLPLYAIVRPTDNGGYEVVGEYKEGKINNVAGFTQFLHDPLAGPGADARAEVVGK